MDEIYTAGLRGTHVERKSCDRIDLPRGLWEFIEQQLNETNLVLEPLAVANLASAFQIIKDGRTVCLPKPEVFHLVWHPCASSQRIK